MIYFIGYLFYISNSVHSFMFYVLPWPVTVAILTVVFIIKVLVFLPRRIAFLLLALHNYLFFRKKGPQIHVSVVNYQQALLFPVHLCRALIESSSMCLSCVRVPIHKCDGRVQRNFAIHRRNRIQGTRRNKLGLLGLLIMSTAETACAIPSTGYALIREKSNDNARQNRMIQNVIKQIESSNPTVIKQIESSNPTVAAPADASTGQGCDKPSKVYHKHLKDWPEVFIADTDSDEFIIDTGTNGFIVKDPSMLTNYVPSRGAVKGINGTPTIYSGTGDLKLEFETECGSSVKVKVKGVVVTNCPYNLIPPQMLVTELKRQGKSAHCVHDDETHTICFIDPNDENKLKRITSFAKSNRLFSIRTKPGYRSFFCHAIDINHEWCSFAGALHVIPPDESDYSVSAGKQREEHEPGQAREFGVDQTREQSPSSPAIVEDSSESENETEEPIAQEPRKTDFSVDNVNLGSEDLSVVIQRRKQAELLSYHERFGHFSFPRLQLMARAGLIPKYLSKVPIPVCPGCAYGKAHRKPIRHKGKRNRLRQATRPGEVVSMDQLVSPTSGFVPTHRGNPTVQRYIGATVFVDHYSDFTYVHLMTKLNAETTVEAKNAFERIAKSHGVTVNHYHSDNGLFDTKLFRDSVQSSNQTLSFCGPNAHHQNGKAENRIKDITTHARTALLHAAHRWPEAVNVHLWPAALKHYTNVRNSMPTQFIDGKRIGNTEPDRYEQSSLSRFSGTEVEPNLDHFHPFGCPVYVLEDSLQAQQSHNKWQDRSRVGIFLCHSPNHATSVPLVLNTRTGNVAPQFHCVYDDDFSTCKRDAKFVSLWQFKAKLSSLPAPATIGRSDEQATRPNIPVPARESVATPISVVFNPPDVEPATGQSPSETDEVNHHANSTLDPATTQEPGITQTAVPPTPEDGTPILAPQTPGLQRANYVSRAGRRGRPTQIFTLMASFFAATSANVISGNPSELHLLQSDVESQSEPHPFAMLMAFVGTSDPDTMTLEEALKQPDRDEFVKAMHKELMDHIVRKHWKVVPVKSVPKPKRPIPMVWSMKRKRDPLGNITKWKARLCAGGHRSVEFVDYWATYSPVVTWSTVRIMLTLALINDWHVRSIDFVLAFPQAPVKTDIFMSPPKVPPDFKILDLPKPSDRITNCYKLIKNLYGLKDAGKTWFDFLSKGLEERGWKPSEIDTCLFTKPGIILMVYVDDAILISADEKLIESEIKSLQTSYALTDDGPLKDYLGTRFEKNADGSLEMTQPKMIERVLEIVGLNRDNIKFHDTPASDSKLLDKDPDAMPRTQEWNYRSAVGCLSYIQAMIRPDITMAVQQCARFCNDPKREHEEAVKRICRYLARTKDKGIVFRPDPTRGLECFVDADWAGSWQHKSGNDPLSAHSRTGFVIMYAGCPIVWASKMQTLIALSTTEAEYIALSTALREVIGVMNLLNELRGRGFKLNDMQPKVVCKTFEDNRSCIEIATNHKTRPRTKHLSVRLHHFRSHVTSGTITIEHISTKDQIADIFTKPLPRDQFSKLRDLLMSWVKPPIARE